VYFERNEGANGTRLAEWRSSRVEREITSAPEEQNECISPSHCIVCFIVEES